MINWGIIGCGNVTEVKSGPAFSKVKNSRLAAVMRRNAILAEDYARRHNVPKFYTDAKKLIADPEINAVYIATPPSSHAFYAIETLKAGKPVYIEKPMALNHAECIEINKTSEITGTPVFVAYYRRALPGFVKVRDMVHSGTVGKPLHVRIELFKPPTEDEIKGQLSWRVVPSVSGGGHFFDLASHQLDYLDFIFGPIRRVKSIAVNQAKLYEAEDMVSATFLFDNDIAGTGTWCFNAPPSSARDIIEITGDRGSIRFSCFSFDPIIVENYDGKKEYINEKPEHVQYYLIEQVVNALTENVTAVSTGETAARTSRVMDEIVKEYYEK
jgi:predicted dehydrogenase